MDKFKVKIVERLERVVKVEAESFEDARDKVEAMYKNCDIVLDSGDFVGVVFALDGVEYDENGESC